nr:MAG TPA: Transcriptional regulator, TetR family Alpha, Helix-Turn-Helix, Transcriptional Repressor.27A [Caudoviricetes sp.]
MNNYHLSIKHHRNISINYISKSTFFRYFQ